MDRSAPALAQATRSAHNFRKKTIQIHPLRKRMAVPTMCRSNGVSRPECTTYPGRDGLLPEAQVQETGYFSVGEQSPKPLFRPSDQEHDFVKMSKSIWAEAHNFVLADVSECYLCHLLWNEL